MASDPPAIRAAIAALESQRGVLDDETLAASLAPLNAALARADANDATVRRADEPVIRHVTVMFVDVVGSTAAGQRLDPEDFHEVMNGALQRFTAIVVAEGGRILKYLGDGMLAAFGMTIATEDDARHAVDAGLSILAAATALRDAIAPAMEMGFAVRVGIDTGTVLVGGGVEGDASIRGNAVNLAARMEQTAPPGGLRIGRATYRLLGGAFETVEDPGTIVKGLAAPVTTYLVTGRSATPASRHGSGRRDAVMIGRAGEMRMLVEVVDEVAAGAGLRAVLVEADAGVGKSRLLAEFASWASGAVGPSAVLSARAHPRSDSQPYSLLRDLLSRWFGLSDGSDPALDREVVLAGLRQSLVTDGDAELLGHLAGFDSSADERVAALSGDPHRMRARAHELVATWLSNLASASAPVVVLLDDVHWADAASLELVAGLVEHHHDLPIAVVCGARPMLHERRPGWSTAIDDLVTVRLDPLDPASAAELTDALLGRRTVLPEQVRAVIEPADGNPYFISEIVWMLVDEGVLVASDDDGPWTVDGERLGAIRRPTTLQALLQARVDTLDAPHRTALQEASVVGYDFWDQVLAAIDAAALVALDGLRDGAYVFEREHSTFAGMGEWTFQHHLLQQFVYESILRKDRVEYHDRAGRWLADWAKATGVDVSGMIGDHFERAGRRAAAADCFARAADDACRRGASTNALEFVARGLKLVEEDDLERLWALRSTREELYFRLGDRNGQDAEIVGLAGLAERMGDASRRAETTFLLSSSWFAKAEMLEAATTAHLAATQAEATGDIRLQARALVLESGARRQIGALADASKVASDAVLLARTFDDAGVEASAHLALACALAESGQLVEARGAAVEAVRLEQHEDMPTGMADALNCAGFVASLLGDYDLARSELSESHRLAAGSGFTFVEKCSLKNLSSVLLLTGDPDGAVAMALEAAAGSGAVGARDVEAFAWLTAGHALIELARWEEAHEALARSHALHLAVGARHCAAESTAGLADLALRRGDHDRAMALVDEVIAFVDSGGSFDGGQEPFRPRLICWRVLHACGDARGERWLTSAHEALVTRADLIDDPATRDRYLTAIPHHREIIERHRALS
jgi:class 3 adenylate cyclase/tetratricopeptide (TPR) repeat protein